VVSFFEILAELYTCYRKRCKRGYFILGEGERHRPRMPRAGAGNRKVLLHVHVPLLSVTRAVAAGRLHHGCVACIERCTHTTTSKQLGLYASLRVLCQSLYLQPSPYAFLYFYDTRPRQPTTWLSLISRPSISRLVAFSKSFKHFKDGYFEVMVKEEGKSHFLNAHGSTKFPFSWTGTPSRLPTSCPLRA